MKEITLQNSASVAIVDDDDFERFGQMPWRVGTHGYVCRGITMGRAFRKAILLHREIVGATSGQVVDHVDRDKLNNMKANLRLGSHAQNMANSKKRKNTRSQFKGVCWEEARQQWKLVVKGVHYGMFVSEKECAIAYNFVATSVFGEFARLNDVHI